jgi:hypothetical protein
LTDLSQRFEGEGKLEIQLITSYGYEGGNYQHALGSSREGGDRNSGEMEREEDKRCQYIRPFVTKFFWHILRYVLHNLYGFHSNTQSC